MRYLKSILVSTVLLTPLTVLASPLVNINKADAAEMLSDLPKASEKVAQAIVDYRNQHGRFKSLDEILQVEGVGRDFININRYHLHLGDDPRLNQRG